MITYGYDNETKNIEEAMHAWKTAMDNTAKEVKKLPKWTPTKGSDGLVDSKLRAAIQQRSTEELEAFFKVCTYCVPPEAMKLLTSENNDVDELIKNAKQLVVAAGEEAQRAEKNKLNNPKDYEQKDKIHKALKAGLENLLAFDAQSKIDPQQHAAKNENFHIALGAFIGGIIGFIAGAAMGALAGLYITAALDPIITVSIAAAAYGLKELGSGMSRGAQYGRQFGRLWEHSRALKSSIKGAERSYKHLQAAIKDAGGIEVLEFKLKPSPV